MDVAKLFVVGIVWKLGLVGTSAMLAGELAPPGMSGPPENGIPAQPVGDRGVLTLHIVDQESNPVPQLEIYTESLDAKVPKKSPPFPGDSQRIVVKDGKFIELRRGTWRIHALPSLARPYAGEAELTVDARTAQTMIFQVAKLTIGQISMTVLSPDGNPVSPLYLWAGCKQYPTLDGSTHTDATGKCSIQIFSDYSCFISIEPLAESPLRKKIIDIEKGTPLDKPITVTLEQKVIVAKCTAMLSEDDEAYPFVDEKTRGGRFPAPYIAFLPKGSKTNTFLHAYFVHDRFEFCDVSPGEYEVLYLFYPRADQGRAFHCPPSEDYTFAIAEKGNIPQDLPGMTFLRWEKNKGAIEGSVKGMPQEALGQLRVVATRIARNGQVSGREVSVLVGPDARFSFTDLPGGIYTLRAMQNDRVVGQLKGVIVESRETPHVSIQCQMKATGAKVEEKAPAGKQD